MFTKVYVETFKTSYTLTRITNTSHEDPILNLFMITSCNIRSL